MVAIVLFFFAITSLIFGINTLVRATTTKRRWLFRRIISRDVAGVVIAAYEVSEVGCAYSGAAEIAAFVGAAAVGQKGGLSLGLSVGAGEIAEGLSHLL